VVLAHHVKENKIFQPPCLLVFEILKTFQVPGPAFQKILRSFTQQRQFGGDDLFEIHFGAGRSKWFEAVFAILLLAGPPGTARTA